MFIGLSEYTLQLLSVPEISEYIRKPEFLDMVSSSSMRMAFKAAYRSYKIDHESVNTYDRSNTRTGHETAIKKLRTNINKR